mgnify:CR=1 FL=1|jgi:hypothetical protein|tara:strand:- start:800 stop:1108 length:309 start_codon:yes stop_codon:yes gene_type:complete
MNPYAGPIRFLGGPLHNQIIHVKVWTRWIQVTEQQPNRFHLAQLPAEPKTENRYDLKALEIRDTTFFEYVAPDANVDSGTDTMAWDVIGFIVRPEKDLGHVH